MMVPTGQSPPQYHAEPLQMIGQAGVPYTAEEQLTYNVKGRPAFSFVDVLLKPGQQVTGDAGSMLWMDGEVPMNTDCHNGCGTALYRTCGGESCCMNTFTGPGKVSFGFHLPGDMLPFAVTPGNGWIICRSSYVVGSQNLIVSSRFAGCSAMCFGGEGAFMTKVTVADGKGMFFAGNYGSLERHEIPAGRSLFVDHGLFFAAHESTRIQIGIVGNVVGFCCGGVGFVMQFYGPCVIYTKSRDTSKLFRKAEEGRDQKRKNQAGMSGQVNIGIR